MFTGIIETTARILTKMPSGLTVERPSSFDDLKIGSSVCVAGVCLSVVKLTKTSMQFDVVAETLKKSRLGTLKKGERVNLERAMRAGDRFEGHVVQGHVEGVGEIIERRMENGESDILIFHSPLSILHSIIPKGSIAIDGVSLTIAEVNNEDVTIALIPHTLKNTTLGSLKKGDRVNIETDVMLRRT